MGSIERLQGGERMSEYIVQFGYEPPTGVKEQIVRCRDCEHYDSERYGCWWFAHAERQPDYSWADEPSDVEPDGFCAWAERRDA